MAGKRAYIYTSLQDLSSGTTANVYGVVKFCKPSKRSRGTDYCKILSITDPSVSDTETKKLKCLLFGKTSSALPDVTVGDIVRFHRLKIETFRDELQGQSGPGWSWLIFSPEEDVSLEPKSNSASYTLTDADKDKVRELRAWIKSEEVSFSQAPDSSPRKRFKQLKDVIINDYFDFLCQVVATSNYDEGVCVLLKVWDGTKTNFPVVELDTSKPGVQIWANPELLDAANGYIVDVAVYDDHFASGSKVKSGDFIQLNNLHAMKHKSSDDGNQYSAVPSSELCLHRGTSYNRCLKVLPPTSPVLVDLKNILKSIADESIIEDASLDQSSIQLVTDMPGTSTSPVGGTPPRIRQQSYSDRRRLIEDQPHIEEQVFKKANSDEDRCIMTTVTVLKGHHHIKRTDLGDVVLCPAPDKFRIRARVKDIQPKPTSPDLLVRVLCPICHFVSPVPCAVLGKEYSDDIDDLWNNTLEDDIKAWISNGLPQHTENGIGYYICPRSEEHKETEEEIRFLEYTFMFQLLLCDDSGWIAAHIWKNHATTLLNGISAASVLKDKQSWYEVKNCLTKLCPSLGSTSNDIQDNPWMEACVMSYTSVNGVCYQMFDTCMAMNDSDSQL